MAESATASSVLQRPVDPNRDHIRGRYAPGAVSFVLYGDYLCPYCRRLRHVIGRLREVLGDRLAYVFRHYPNERAHPGAELISRAAEAAGNQGRFWEMHDWLYEQDPLPGFNQVRAFAKRLGLDMSRFDRDVEAPETFQRVAEDLADG